MLSELTVMDRQGSRPKPIFSVASQMRSRLHHVFAAGIGVRGLSGVTMLDLRDLGKGFPAISPAFGQYLAEAGGVCLESQGHSPGISLAVRGDHSVEHAVNWPDVTDQMLACLNDPEVATEHGAVGVAVLLTKQLTGFSVIQRSRKGTGFDYWLGDEDELPFQNKARLEISGIRSGSSSDVGARVRTKLAQVTPSDETGLPAYVVVVEFGQPGAEVRGK